jgi:cytochrome oxidase Cu insertion factor (SCO1/SenC/PrrC family)
MQSASSDAPAPRARSTAKLWLVLALCAAPLVASYAAYFFWRPSQFVNHGELLEPRPLPDTTLTLLDGSTLRVSQLRGEWVLLVADRAACDEHCARKLTYIRQIRLAQGKEMERIERVWLLTDGAEPDPALLAVHPELYVAHARGSALIEALPASASVADYIYIVDPLGNLMMRYPPEADPRRILKDLSRLLRHSKWK